MNTWQAENKAGSLQSCAVLNFCQASPEKPQETKRHCGNPDGFTFSLSLSLPLSPFLSIWPGLTQWMTSFFNTKPFQQFSLFHFTYTWNSSTLTLSSIVKFWTTSTKRKTTKTLFFKFCLKICFSGRRWLSGRVLSAVPCKGFKSTCSSNFAAKTCKWKSHILSLGTVEAFWLYFYRIMGWSTHWRHFQTEHTRTDAASCVLRLKTNSRVSTRNTLRLWSELP